MALVGSIEKFVRRKTPTQLFWCFAVTHIVLWTLIPTLTSPNAPLDVIEGYAWGREWLIGTYKHPPMQSWWLEVIGILTFGASWAHFFASALAVAITFWAVWQTGRRIADDKTALLGALLLEGAVYYNFTSPEFNPNVLQLPFWALIAWSFHRAVKEDCWFDWALLGVWGAGGLYTKYSTSLMLAVVATLLIVHPEGRRRLRGFGPYLSLALILGLFAPHMAWLIDHDFLPFDYAGSRTSEAEHLYQHILFPIGFLLAQALSLSAMFLLLLLMTKGRLTWKSRLESDFKDFNRLFLHAVALGPLVLLILASFIVGFRPRDMWGACLWNFIGVWLMVFLAPKPEANALKRFALGWLFVFSLGLIALTVSNYAYPYVKLRELRVHFPGRPLGEAIAQEWNKRYVRPLAYRPIPLKNIIGDTWLAGNAAYYAAANYAGRPHVFINGDYLINEWADRERIWEEGGVLVWCGGDKCSDVLEALRIPYGFQFRFPGAEIQQPLTLSRHTKAALPQAVIGWAIVPPSSKWRHDARYYCRAPLCPQSWFKPAAP